MRGKKRHEKGRKTILGEQLNDALQKGEAREAHRLSRMLAGRGMEARRRHLTSIPTIRQCSEEKAKTLEQPINKGGRTGLRIIFSDEVGSMTARIDPIVVDQNDPAGHRLDVPASFCVEAHALESVCRVEHSGRTSEDFGLSKQHKHGIGDNTKCEGS